MLSIEQLHSHTCAELVGMCKELGLPHSGRRKQLLVQALFDYQRSNGGIPLPVLARNSFRSHNAAAARYQQQQALLHHQQQQSGQMLPHTPPRSSQANGAVAAPVSFPLQKQLSGHPVGCVVAGQSAAGGLCGPLGPGFPPPPTGAAAVAGGVTGSQAAPTHAAPATASTGGSTTSNNSGGGAGQGVFSRCICKGAAGGSSSRGRVHAKSLKCKICGSLSSRESLSFFADEEPFIVTPAHLSCYPDVTGPAAQKFVCSTCRMKRLDPFYPVEEVLWETRLEGSHYSVDITSYVLRKWRAEGKEVIVRCMQLDQPLLYQTWPKSIQISINGRTEETVAAPSWEHKRRDMPIVITQYLKNGKNRVEFWWTNYEEPKSFHLAILLCTYSSPEALAKMLELRSHVGEAEARRRVLSIVTNKNGRRGSTQQEDDDDVTCMEVTRRIKLLCPITFTRIAVPCRGASCMHLQCFDLWGFLLVTRNTKAFNTRWKCPECQLYVRPDELVIDDFVLQILKSTSEDATVIELEADGSYRVVSEQELKEESKRAETQRLRAAGACRVKRAIDEDASCASPSAAAALPEDGPTKKAFEIVEMLSSSEDEEEALAIESSSSAAPPAQAPPDLSASPTAPTAACALEAAAGTAAPGAALAAAAVSAAAPVAASTTATRRAAEDTQAGAESASSAASSAIPPAAGALPPALVSSLRSAAAAASAAAPGGMLFSPAATVAAHQQQQRHEPVAVPQERRLSFSPEEETEEGEDDEDSAIRVGRFYKRLRRTALSPASSPASPGTVEKPASVPPRQQQRQLVPGGSVSEGLSAAVGAAAATSGSLQRRMSARAAARAASASAAAGGAAESAQSVFTKAHALTAAAFPSTSSEQLHEQPPSSSEGGDVVVVISSDEEEELVAAAWTPVLTPQQQRRQQRRQQEQVRRRLQDEERQEQRKLVAQAAAAARQHARRTETLPEETPADVGAEAKDQQNISLPQIATLTLLSPPAATEAGAQALLSNLHLPFPATPQRGAAIEHSVSKDTNSETHVGSKAAELLQLLLERQRQELEQREKLPAQEVEQQQQLSLHRLTSVSSEEEASHQPAPSCWQAPERHADSSSCPADAPTSTNNNNNNRNVPWTLGEATITGRGRQSSIERAGEVATARPPAQSAAAADSPAAAGLGGTAVPTPGSAPVHGDAAAESSGFEQESSRVHDSTPVADAANLFFAPTSLSSASFPGVIPPCSFPCAASQLARPACGAAAGVAAAAPFVRRDGSNDSGNTRGRNFGVPDACVVPTSSYYYLDPSSINVSNSSVLQQKQISSQVQQQPFQQQPFQQQRQQEHVQPLRPCGGTDEGALPTYGTVHNTRNGSADPSSVLEMYSHALQHQQPQQILEQLQQQVQQAMQESVQLQQHVKEQQRVQQQRVEQHAMQQLQSLQQPRTRVPLSRETVEQAEAAEEQLACRDSATTDSREREETRSDATKKARTVAGAHSSSNRSTRFSTRERSSRSNSMERADADAGYRMKEGEDLISESCRQPFTSAQRAPLQAVFHKADAAPAPARDKVEGSFSASTRVSAEVRGQPVHEHSQNQQQQHPLEYEQLQRTQQQQQLRRGTTGVTPGRSVFPEAHPAPGKPFASPAAAAEAAGPASAAPASQLVWPVAASATAPVRTTYNQAASAGTDRKPAAGEATLPAEAAAAGMAATKGMAANLSAAGGIQGATGARKGPRMSLPPRSCIAGLRPDSGGPSKSTASSESDRNVSCAAVSPVASSSGSLVVTSTAAMPRAGVALPAASTGSHGKQQPGLSRSAPSVAAPAAFIPSMGSTGGSGASLQPKSPARRLLVPPVPPPLKSLRQAGSAGGGAQEDRGSNSTSAHQGQSSAVSGPLSGSSSSGSQLGQEGRIPSRLPAPGAATTLTESSTAGPTAASATSTTVSPAPAPPRPHGTTVAAAGRPSVAALAETTGREATLRDMGHGGEFLACWSKHTSINSNDRRSTRAVSDVGDCDPGLERRRSGSSEGQRGSSNNSSRGRVCSPDSMHYSREADYASSDMSLPPAAAESEDFSAPASYSTQRGHGEFRARSSGSNKEGDGQAETSGKNQGSKDLNTADYGTEDSSGLQSRSGASTRARCSSPVRAAVASHSRNPRQETEAAVSCCSTLEDLHRGEEEDLYGRPLGVERQVFAARHDEVRKACAKGSSSTAANDTAGAFRKESESYSSDKESTASQTAGIPDSADTAGLQRTEFRQAGAAAADHPPLLPRQAAGGRRRVSVVLALHPATHAVRPPAGFFSTEDSVAASPSADSGTRRSARETDGDELHAGAVLDSSTNDSDVSQLHHDQQKDGTADSSCPCVTEPYTSSLPVREDARESGVGASDAAVTSVRDAVGSSFSESNNALPGGAAPPIDATRTDFNWTDGLLSDGCGEAGAVSSSSLYSAVEPTARTSRAQQKPQLVSQGTAKELQRQFVPTSSEAQGQEHDSETPAAGPENNKLRRDGDTDAVHSSTLLSPTPRQLQTRAALVGEQQCEPTSAASRVREAGSTTDLPDTATGNRTAGALCTDEEHGRGVEVDSCSKGIASCADSLESSEEGAAGALGQQSEKVRERFLKS